MKFRFQSVLLTMLFVVGSACFALLFDVHGASAGCVRSLVQIQKTETYVDYYTTSYGYRGYPYYRYMYYSTPHYANRVVYSSEYQDQCASDSAANYANSTLVNAIFTGTWVHADFSNTNLRGAVFENIDLSGANFENADLTGASFVGSNLTNSRFLRADLSNANLTRSNIRGADITEANMGRSTLDSLQSGNVMGVPKALPLSWVLASGYLVGPKANLINANLDSVDLSNANLSEVMSGNVTGNPSLPDMYKIVNGYLVGPGVNLSYAQLVDADLGGTSLINADLTGADFSRADLSFADLSSTRAGGTTFTASKLNGTILSGMSPTTGIRFNNVVGTPDKLPDSFSKSQNFIIGPGSDLSSTDLGMEDLSSVSLLDVKSGHTSGSPILPEGTRLVSGYLVGPGADLSNVLDLSTANLTAVDLSDANLEGANLSQSTLTSVKSKRVRGVIVALPQQFSLKGGYLIGPGVDLSGQTLTGAELSGLTLTGIRFSNSHLEYANLRNTSLAGCSCDHVSFRGAHLENTNFGNADVSYSDFGESSPASAYFNGASLTGVKSGSLQGISTTCWWYGRCETNGPVFSGGWFLYGGYFVGPGANLTGAWLGEADFSERNLSGAELSNAYLVGANLSNSNLSRANMRNVRLDQARLAGAVLDGSDLREASFSGAQTSGVVGEPTLSPQAAIVNGTLIAKGAVFQDLFLGNSDLSNVDLRFIRASGLSGNPVLPTGTKLLAGYLLGPSAIVQNVTLDGLDLSNINFQGADLSYSIIRNSRIEGTDFRGANLYSISSASNSGQSYFDLGYGLVNGYVVGPNVKLSNADLAGGDLSGLSLNGSSLNGSNLADANLRGAELGNADLSGALLEGVQSGQVSGFPKVLPNEWQLISGYLLGPKANLRNSDLSGISAWSLSIAGADFSNSTLDSFSCKWCILNGANFTSTRMSGSSLENSQIQWANFKNADLSGVRIQNSNLNNSSFDGTELAGATVISCQMDATDLSKTRSLKDVLGRYVDGNVQLPSGWSKIQSYFVGPGANLTGSYFSDTSFAGISLRQANLSLARFRNVDFTKSDFFAADLSYASFAGSTFKLTKSGSIIGVPNLPTGMTVAGGYLIGPDVDLAGANLSGLTLNRLNFSNAIMNSANLSRIDLSDSSLTGTDLRGSNLSQGNFHATDFSGANVRGAIITGANFAGANFYGVTSGEVTGSGSLPVDWEQVDGYLIGSGANLSGIQLEGKEFSGLDISAINFQNSKLNRVTFNNSNLAGANFKNSTLSNCTFTGSSLRNASLDFATLSTATLANTNVQGAGFRGSVLIGLVARNLIGEPGELPHQWTLRAGSLFGPKVNLSGQTFTGADLSGLNLYGANLSSSDFTNADLTDSDLRAVNFESANLSGAKLIDSDLRSSNLKYVNLSHASLNSALLSGADMSGSLWSGTDISATNLSSVNLDNSTSNNILGVPANLASPWQLVKGSFVSPLQGNFAEKMTGLPVLGSELQIDAGSWEPGVSSTYQWLRNGVPIPGATNNAYLLGQADVGNSVTVIVTISKPNRVSATWKAPSMLVTQSSLARIKGDPRVGATLSATPISLGESLATYQWFRAGSRIFGASSSTYVPVATDVAKQISVQVTLSQFGLPQFTSVSEPVTISSGFLPVIQVSLPASVTPGQTLKSDLQQITGYKYLYQWYRDGLAVAYATRASYAVHAEDIGTKLKLSVVTTKSGYANSIFSTNETQVTPNALNFVGTPAIIGIVRLGKIISVNPGTWDFGVRFTYSWYRSGILVSSGVSKSYRIGSEDLGKDLYVVVTGSKLGYTTISRSSDSVLVN